MANKFGKIFSITTFGESHGEAIGVVIDGCPAGLSITIEEINQYLALRRPGFGDSVSPRDEADEAEIISGVFEGKTTGAPIAITIKNKNFDSNNYEPIKNLLRPGHANFTYLQKYGIYDFRGGGRASARETACRVAAGAVAIKLLEHYGIKLVAFVSSVGNESAKVKSEDIAELREKTYASPVYCPDEKASTKIINTINKVKSEGDSIGGIVGFVIKDVPIGLGEPIYDKLESRLASAMFSIPAVKGFEIGDGFNAAKLQGSEHNDPFVKSGEQVMTSSNHAGGILAGISNGMPIIGEVAFKPTPSITKPQKTIDLSNNKTVLQLPLGSKHDPCVAIRAVPVVEAMCAMVIADFLLLKAASSHIKDNLSENY